jgi:hypothetical protein
MPRFTHLAWKDCPVNEVVKGIWFQPPRTVSPKDGRNGYQLGEVERPDGTRIGFTMPTMLAQQLADAPIGAYVQITYLGTTPTASGYQMMRFHTTVVPLGKPEPESWFEDEETEG